MKKTVRVAIATMLVLAVSICCFVGCSSKNKAVGKWNLVEMTVSGQTLNIEQLKSFGMEGDMYMELTEDGKVKFVMAGETMEGTYVAEGDSVTVTIEDEPQTGKIEGNKLTIEQDGAGMVFEKE